MGNWGIRTPSRIHIHTSVGVQSQKDSKQKAEWCLSLRGRGLRFFFFCHWMCFPLREDNKRLALLVYVAKVTFEIWSFNIERSVCLSQFRADLSRAAGATIPAHMKIGSNQAGRHQSPWAPAAQRRLGWLWTGSGAPSLYWHCRLFYGLICRAAEVFIGPAVQMHHM